MRQCAARNEAYLALPCLSRTLKHPPPYSWDDLNISFAWHGSLAGQVAFSAAVLHLLLQERPLLMFFASVTHPYQGHDMTSCCWLVVMDSERFASPIKGIFCSGLNAYCMHIRPLFLRTSGSSGVLKALFFFFFFGWERHSLQRCNERCN